MGPRRRLKPILAIATVRSLQIGTVRVRSTNVGVTFIYVCATLCLHLQHLCQEQHFALTEKQKNQQRSYFSFKSYQ